MTDDRRSRDEHPSDRQIAALPCEARTREVGPETEAVVERDGCFLNVTWTKRGKDFACRVYEPQMMDVSPALADVLALTYEEACSALPCKGGEADLLATLIEPSPGFFQVKAGHHAAFNIAVQRLRARHSAPSPKPDMESADEGALREAADKLVNQFAWSAVRADCAEAHVYLTELINDVRSALSKDTEASAGEQQ